MIVTLLGVSFKRILSKNIVFWEYEHFNQHEFVHKLDLEMNKGKFYNSDKPYDNFSNLTKTITDKNAPIKQKKVIMFHLWHKTQKSYHVCILLEKVL